MNVNDFLASAELPLVAMIKVVAASMMTTLKIRNLTLFRCGHDVVGELVW